MDGSGFGGRVGSRLGRVELDRSRRPAVASEPLTRARSLRGDAGAAYDRTMRRHALTAVVALLTVVGLGGLAGGAFGGSRPDPAQHRYLVMGEQACRGFGPKSIGGIVVSTGGVQVEQTGIPAAYQDSFDAGCSSVMSR
jgi:hypothetical protein